MNNFIPSWHFRTASEKLTAKWCMEAVNYLWYNTNNLNLLHGKDIAEIEGYASGEFDMRPFVKMFKSLRKDLVKHGKTSNTKDFLKQMDLSGKMGLEFNCLPLLPEKLNSAVAVTSKIPVEISVNATDPLAIEKKQRDINFIKNKALVELEMTEVTDRLGLPDPDLGETENSAVPFSDSPFGLDLNEPDELDIFINLIYSLKIESAFETILQAFAEIKNRRQIRLLEIKDHFSWGVSSHDSYQDKTTGLPNCEYVFPGEIETPFSYLPDYSDNTHRIRTKRVSALELMEYFGSEIKNEEELTKIISGKEFGYCDCNKLNNVKYSEYGSFKVTLRQFQVRSVDSVGIAKTKHKKGFTTLTEEADKTAEKLWGQNTYSFWWLENTDYVFGIERLGFAHREKGKESIQNFSTNIYKSQEKSAVELSIGENKKAQIADIKLQHAVIMSLPAGRYIDLRFLRGAMTGLTDSPDEGTMDELIHLALERNIVMGDTEGFDGKNDGQFKPVLDLPGGLRSEIVGYLNIIASANANISRITGINQNLTGQKTEELNGLQQFAIESSINALSYCADGIAAQDQKLFSSWANIIKQAVEGGGKPKEAIMAIIGSRKVSVIDGLDDVRLHDIGVTVKVARRQRENEYFLSQLNRLVQKGALSAADEFMVTNIDNPKDQYAFLAVKEQKFLKRQAQERQEMFAQQQQLTQQQGQNIVAGKQAEGQADIQTVYAKGTVQQKILELAASLGIQASQLDAIVKRNLQNDRNFAQKQKNIDTLREKANLEQQESLI